MKVRAKKFNPKFVETLKQLGWINEPIIQDRGLIEGYTIGIDQELNLNKKMQYCVVLGINVHGEFVLDTWGDTYRDRRFSRYSTDFNFIAEKLAKITEITQAFKQGNFEAFLKPGKTARRFTTSELRKAIEANKKPRNFTVSL